MREEGAETLYTEESHANHDRFVLCGQTLHKPHVRRKYITPVPRRPVIQDTNTLRLNACQRIGTLPLQAIKAEVRV